ncbi:MAG: hypothetical protein P4M11_14280 [Candidatus Pacebacteria bacterium]|nr:hypothetical protein [Candidatus Paceibacterota bacterium]
MSCGCGKPSLKYGGELESLNKRFPAFGKTDLYHMIEWFHSHSIDGVMKRDDFLEAMGLTSRAGYIFERMFEVMDQNSDGNVSSRLKLRR